MLHNEKENLPHSPSGAETFRNDSKYRLPDDREVVLCHSVISVSQHVPCTGIKIFNEVRMLNSREPLLCIHCKIHFVVIDFIYLSMFYEMESQSVMEYFLLIDKNIKGQNVKRGTK